jgi:hypothetical protein
MNEGTRTRDRRFTLRGWHIALTVPVVLVILIVLCVVVRKNRVEERIRALRAAGYPTTFAELAEYTKLSEGVQNAADVYEQAFAAYVRPVDEVNVPPGLGQAKRPDRGVPLPPPMATAVSKLLASNQKCLALLHDAGSITECRYDDDYTQMTATLPGCRHCGQLLSVAAIYHASRGDAEAAVTCVRDGLRLSDSLHREPTLTGYLLHLALVALNVSRLERSLSLTAFTDLQLQEVHEALARTAGTLDLAEALVAKRCSMIEMCRDPTRLGPSPQVPRVHMLPGLRVMCLEDILDFMADYLEAAGQPPRERLVRCREIEARIDQLSFWQAMTKTLMSAWTWIVQRDLWTRAYLDLANTALAVERYRLATGKVPQQLEELVPQYLAQVPIDPFDGQPIRYRPGPPGYLLYSVGEDGQDNGGRERDEKDDNAPYDLCFIVTR